MLDKDPILEPLITGIKYGFDVCEKKMGTHQRILAGCNITFSQRCYRWRHDKALKQISEQVVFHCDCRVKIYKNKADNGRQSIDFIPAGKKKAVGDAKDRPKIGILNGTRG
jgi:hypothetical protein